MQFVPFVHVHIRSLFCENMTGRCGLYFCNVTEHVFDPQLACNNCYNLRYLACDNSEGVVACIALLHWSICVSFAAEQSWTLTRLLPIVRD